MALTPLRNLGSANSLKDLRSIKDSNTQAKAKQAQAKAKQARAEHVKAEFDRLESSFVSSNGTDVDHAKTDENKVVLDAEAAKSSSFRTALSVTTDALFGVLKPSYLGSLLGVKPPMEVTGVAKLGEDGKAKSMDADVKESFKSGSLFGFGVMTYRTSKTMKMSSQEDGSKIYELNDRSGKTVVQEQEGRLTVLEDSTTQNSPFGKL